MTRRNPEGPLPHQVWTATTHAMIAFGVTVLGAAAAAGLERSGAVAPLMARLLVGVAAGWSYGFYVGRETGESDPFWNRGSVLDMTGGLVGALAGLGLWINVIAPALPF